MGMFDFLTKFLGGPEGHGELCANGIRPRDEVWEAVNLVVKLSHPDIHYVPHYRKKLMPAVEHTLKYADELIAKLPPPIPVTADSYDTNPLIRAAFSDASQFRTFFSEHRKLKKIFQKTDISRCYALLLMNYKEKKILGVDMDGEIIKRDVLQTSIDFSDHHIVAPMISEDKTRKELSLRAIALLASHSLEDILSLIEWKKKMETEKYLLEVKLHIRHDHVRNRNSFLPGNEKENNEVSKMLKHLDRKIAEVHAEIDTPEDYLNKVADMLYHPEQFLRSEPVRMMINTMNIIIDKKRHGKGEEIRFAEFSTGTGVRKAAVLVECGRF